MAANRAHRQRIPFAAMRRAPLLASAGCVTALIGLAFVHAWRVPFYAGDDQIWRAHAARGLAVVWTEPSPPALVPKRLISGS